MRELYGGPTTLSNLTMLCRRHHRAVHEEGYQVERQADGELQFRRPNGVVIPHVPRSPELPADPVAAIRARNEENGLALDARTTMPGWIGERLNVAYAIDVLHPLAIAPRAPVPTPDPRREIQLGVVRFSDPWYDSATD